MAGRRTRPGPGHVGACPSVAGSRPGTGVAGVSPARVVAMRCRRPGIPPRRSVQRSLPGIAPRVPFQRSLPGVVPCFRLQRSLPVIALQRSLPRIALQRSLPGIAPRRSLRRGLPGVAVLRPSRSVPLLRRRPAGMLLRPAGMLLRPGMWLRPGMLLLRRGRRRAGTRITGLTCPPVPLLRRLRLLWRSLPALVVRGRRRHPRAVVAGERVLQVHLVVAERRALVVLRRPTAAGPGGSRFGQPLRQGHRPVPGRFLPARARSWLCPGDPLGVLRRLGPGRRLGRRWTDGRAAEASIVVTLGGAAGLVHGGVHGPAASLVAGIALAGEGFPFPSDLVDPAGLVVPPVCARVGAPAVHRATGPDGWQRSVTASPTLSKNQRCQGGAPGMVARLRCGGMRGD